LLTPPPKMEQTVFRNVST